MKIYRLSIFLLLILIFCTSCAKNEKVNSNDSSTINNNQKMYDFTDSNFKNNSLKPIEEDENFYFYKKVIHSFEKDFEIEQYIIKLKDSKGRNIDTISFFDEHFAYYSCDSNGEINGELGIIDYKNNTYQKILELPKGSQACINTVNQNYIVWKESVNDSNWEITRLHLYDKTTMKDISFYNHTINVDTKKVIAWNWSNPVIVENTIYFDDVVSSSNDIYKVNMLKYNIKEDKISTVKSMAKWPIKYNNGVIWQQLNCDGINTDVIFYDGFQTKVLFSFINQSVASFTADQESLAIINMLNSEMLTTDSTKEHDSFDSSGLQIFSNNHLQQVLRTKPTIYIQEPQICGDYVSFQLNSSKEFSPKIYNLKNDIIFSLDSIPENFYSVFFAEESGYFVSTNDEQTSIYKVKLM